MKPAYEVRISDWSSVVCSSDLLSDVAQVTRGADLPTQYVWHGAPAQRAGPAGIAPAVTLAIAKQPGRNAADITDAITQRMQGLRGSLIPQGVQYTITRDYGQTATAKAEKIGRAHV